MKTIFALIGLSISLNSFAVCEDARLNDTDKIFEGFLCTPTKVIGAEKIKNLCFIRAKTIEDDGVIYEYTHMQTEASNKDGWKAYYSTFKWHHKKNNSVSKMWDTSKKVKMKDVTAADFMTANIYKISEFSKKTKRLEIEVYKKKALLGLKKRKWYSASFKCQKID